MNIRSSPGPVPYPNSWTYSFIGFLPEFSLYIPLRMMNIGGLPGFVICHHPMRLSLSFPPKVYELQSICKLHLVCQVPKHNYLLIQRLLRLTSKSQEIWKDRIFSRVFVILQSPHVFVLYIVYQTRTKIIQNQTWPWARPLCENCPSQDRHSRFTSVVFSTSKVLEAEGIQSPKVDMNRKHKAKEKKVLFRKVKNLVFTSLSTVLLR